MGDRTDREGKARVRRVIRYRLSLAVGKGFSGRFPVCGTSRHYYTRLHSGRQAQVRKRERSKSKSLARCGVLIQGIQRAKATRGQTVDQDSRSGVTDWMGR